MSEIAGSLVGGVRTGIGSSIIGGTANSVLYIGSTGKLAQHNPGFTFDGTTFLAPKIGAATTSVPSGYGAKIDAITSGKALMLGGPDSYSGANDGGGTSFINTHNSSGNRQLSLIASEQVGDATKAGFRYITGFDLPTIDGISGDGSSNKNITIGHAPTLVGIGFTVGLTQSDIKAKLHVLNTTSSVKAGIIQAAPSQSETLLEFQDSSGTAMAVIDAVGNITKIRSVSYSWPSSQGGSSTYLQNDGSGNLSWASVSASPGGSSKQVQFNSSGSFGGATGFEYQSGSSPNVLITAQNASHIALAVKAASSQTANIQQWQDSNGVALANINASGAGTFTQNGLGLTFTPTAGITVANTTASTGGSNYQTSPSLVLTGHAWNSTGSTDNQIDIRHYVFAQTAATPYGIYKIEHQRAGGGYSTLMDIRGTGVANFYGGPSSLGSTISLSTSSDASLTMNSDGGAVSPNISFNVSSVNKGVFQVTGGNMYFNGTSSVALVFRAGGGTNGIYIDTSNNINMGVENTANAKLQVNCPSSSTIGEIIKGAAFQSSDLQQWQDSSSSILAKIDPTGIVQHGGLSRVSTQFDKMNDISLAAITGLSATLIAGKSYSFRVVLHVTAGVVGGEVVDLGGGTATATAIISQVNVLANTTNVFSETSRQTSLTGASAGVAGDTSYFIVMEGLITVNAAGTFKPRIAQKVSNGTATSVLVGSYMMVNQIA